MIDTHAHIDDEQYQSRLAEFILEQQKAGVEAILVPGVDVANVEAVWQVCQQYPNYLYPAIGLHPENIGADWRQQLDILYHSLQERPYIAIGEIGLDYHFDTSFRVEQQQALRQQLSWAKEKNLPVMLHVRDATEDALNILRDFAGLRGVMHCWSGSEEVAQQLVQMGLYLGIGGIVTFKNCKLREHLSSIPLERLVLETDAPYMAPVPHRGECNQSAWIRYVIAELSRVYGRSCEETEMITNQSAKLLFGIK